MNLKTKRDQGEIETIQRTFQTLFGAELKKEEAELFLDDLDGYLSEKEDNSN